ncbi:MAG: ABC transporter ATP-binding protein/permease [Acholeplasmatales bacterium]|nr:ABC transporter ATP-binding protein/permease [Acholeplasmatales bacterium]
MPGMRGTSRKFNKKQAFGRIMRLLFKSYPVHATIIILCIIVTAIGSIVASLFLPNIIGEVIYPGMFKGYSAVKGTLKDYLTALCIIYGISITCVIIQAQVMASMGQGFLNKLRKSVFDKMESLPISYFDQHKHGDIMSTYTNDIDAIRQLVTVAIPQATQTLLTVTLLFILMLSYSIYLCILIIFATIAIFMVTKKIGGGSAKYFIAQQKSLAQCEAFVEEMMNGQKVVKVFCHEEQSKKDFEVFNEKLNSDAYKANAYANMLGPIIHNIGNVLYVIVAIVGVIFVTVGVKNPSVGFYTFKNVEFKFNLNAEYKELEIGIAVAFLGMSRQFANSFNQISMQLNSAVMGLAGADRMFELLDQQPEVDNGYVTLVNAEIDSDGNIKEVENVTGHWAWKHPHQEDGTITYTELKGDIRFYDVDFGYKPDKIVLHDVSIYAKPGQKIAFVGATGAGKTTITNLINRFYDIADGKIRYDGININKIKKADLRRSIGIVLQDVNLFTGTVKDNIRYGKLDATDDEIIEAAKIANAYDFIERLPEGFDTMLTGNGSQLSQGQRQLISIARAAVANAPVMILDEATSSIDTRTEALLSKGMDGLMKGRTVFVIAHRLSTVRNSNAIMVLDHGKIIERGDHDDLIKNHGTYYQLYTGAFELE